MALLGPFHAVDDALFHLVNRTLENPAFDRLMPILSDKWVAFGLAAALIGLLLVQGSRREWVLVAVAIAAVALSDLSANALKHLLERTRPCHVLPDVHLLAGCTRSFSLPSNHASNMSALAGVAWLTLRRWRWALVVLAAAVSYSRVYLGVHYPSDVLVGALWGAAVGWTLTQGVVRLWPGLVRRSVAEEKAGAQSASG